MQTIWAGIRVACFFGVVAVAIILAVGGTIVVWQAPEPEKTYVQVLGIVVDWPLAILVVLLVSAFVFRPQLGGLIDRIITLNTPFGGIDAPQQTPTGGGEPPPDASGDVGPVAPVGPPGAQNDAVPAPAPGGLTAYEAEQLRHQLRLANDQWFRWWANYMWIELVPATKAVLHWFGLWAGTPVQKGLFDAIWSPKILAATQREGIINALWNIDAVARDANAMRLTDLGIKLLNHWDNESPGWRNVYFQYFPPVAPPTPPNP